MTPDRPAVGFFGKLPCRGDFLQRRVRQEFVEIWDSWLQQCLAESAAQMRERWLDAYLTSPVWRFALSPGICGAGAYGGVMVPSVDRVGRYFPLTILTQANPDESALAVACGAATWFDLAEALALRAPEATDFEAFDASVAQLPGLIDSTRSPESAELRARIGESSFPRGFTAWQVPLRSVHSLQRAAVALAARELERTLRPLSVWWSDGSNGVEPAWLCVRGLPSPEGFAALLSGEWTGSGWPSVSTSTVAPRESAADEPLLALAAEAVRS